MADELSRALSQDDKHKAIKWLKTRSANYRCSACGSAKWIMGNHILAIPVFSGGNMVLGGTTYPVLPVACERCGNLRLHSAVVMGLVPGESEREQSKEQPVIGGQADAR